MEIGTTRLTYADRVEELVVDMDIDGAKLSKQQRALVKKYFGVTGLSGDTATFRVNIEYFGKVVEVLMLATELLDAGLVVSAKTCELRMQKSLIQEVLLQLEKLEHKMEG